jgi:hypothetical protein
VEKSLSDTKATRVRKLTKFIHIILLVKSFEKDRASLAKTYARIGENEPKEIGI